MAAEKFPHLHVDSDAIYIRDGKFWTSAGVTAGIDLALALVQDDFGVEVAQTVARHLVMFLHRPGGQTQFASPVWVPRAERSTVRAVQSVVEAAPGGDHRLPVLAAAAAMSVRHFTRVVAAQVGETPGWFVGSACGGRRRAASPRPPTTRSRWWPAAAASAPPRRCAGSFTADSASPPTSTGGAFAPPRPMPWKGPPHDADRRGRRVRPPADRHPPVPQVHRARCRGPYEALQRIPHFDVTFIGHERGEFRTENGMLAMVADATFEELAQPDVIVFPGGVGSRPLVHDDAVLVRGSATPTPRRG